MKYYSTRHKQRINKRRKNEVLTYIGQFLIIGAIVFVTTTIMLYATQDMPW